MADWGMEPQVWVPCNFQQADWSMEHAVWVPGLPGSCESESTEMTCLEETIVHSSSTEQQLVQYAAAATPNYDNPISVFERKVSELAGDYALRRKKIHRYPASIQDLDERYTVPTVVSIGPYHHGRDHLKKAEEAKHAAAYACIMSSERRSVQEMYGAVVSVANEARSLYDKETMEGIEDKDFLPMMFYDACFLVQWMRIMYIRDPGYPVPWLKEFVEVNKKNIQRDILLFENQLPWVMVETVRRFTPVPLDRLLSSMRWGLQARWDQDMKPFVLDDNYVPPHLLGFVRFCIVGKSEELPTPAEPVDVKAVSVSAIELAEIGITLRPSKTIELVHMGIQKVGLSTELCLAPLSLTYKRASLLVNMAAFEVTSDPRTVGGHVDENVAVCSYLRFLGMLVHREEDVQELRSKNLLQGGGGLTNKEALRFFTSLQDLPYGNSYERTVGEIEAYKQNQRIYVKAHVLWYKNAKTMVAVLSVIATVSSILGVLISALHNK